ncbi:AAA family ATPase [Alteromonas sp. P256]|uniref:AAA family ATPase n=1 Tax=Alteromonas sp. P256 TaxID=3117399 RepID=UPI002FE15B95
MTGIRIDEFARRCNELDGEMDFQYLSVSPSIEFSNTGRRGGQKKYFSISLIELIKTLRDIHQNISSFAGASPYNEALMRRLFAEHITSVTTNALSTVQTLPLYGVIAKVIHLTNNLPNQFEEKEIPFDSDKFEIAIEYLESQLPDEEKYLDTLALHFAAAEDESEIKGSNTIYYGAPGVGKSFKIDQICNDNNSIRTIFHPDTQYSDFVGCLKPKMDGADVVYEFRAGPFTKAIEKAYTNENEHIYLVIEEINRAASAAVFGEVFQLLDRDSEGRSVYPIDLTDPDMLEYLLTNAPEAIENGQLRIPVNLSLFATMNSSDQAVMPMDTAFKRRWMFEYIRIDFSDCPNGMLSIPIRDNGEVKVSWADFAQTINNALVDNSIPEDRLLGPWFLSNAELQTIESTQKALTGKLCLYLWDDVLRHGQSSIVFDLGIKNYGQLNTSFEPNNAIFNERIEQALLDASVVQDNKSVEE